MRSLCSLACQRNRPLRDDLQARVVTYDTEHVLADGVVGVSAEEEMPVEDNARGAGRPSLDHVVEMVGSDVSMDGCSGVSAGKEASLEETGVRLCNMRWSGMAETL